MVCVLSGLLVAAGCRSADTRYDPAAWGLTYQLRKLDAPRPNRVHVLRVDVSEGKTKPVVVMIDVPWKNAARRDSVNEQYVSPQTLKVRTMHETNQITK